MSFLILFSVIIVIQKHSDQKIKYTAYFALYKQPVLQQNFLQTIEGIVMISPKFRVRGPSTVTYTLTIITYSVWSIKLQEGLQ